MSNEILLGLGHNSDYGDLEDRIDLVSKDRGHVFYYTSEMQRKEAIFRWYGIRSLT